MNCIIYKKNSDEIHYFIRDCIKDGNNYIGTNRKVYGIKSQHFDIKWTDDEIDPIIVFDEEEKKNKIVGWKKNVSEVNEITEPTDYIEEFKNLDIDKLYSKDQKQLLLKVAYTIQDIIKRRKM